MNAINTRLSLLACGGPSIECQKLYKAVGFSDFGPLKRYVFFVKINVPVEYIFGKNKITKIFSSIAQPFFSSITKIVLSTVLKKNEIRFESVTSFGKEVDKIEANSKCTIFPTDSSLLNWAISAPEKENYSFQIYLDDALVGYIILRVGFFHDKRVLGDQKLKIGSLHHYRLMENARSVKLKKEVLAFSLKYLLNKNIDLFECQSLDDQMFQACKRLFMFEKGGNKVFFRPKKYLNDIRSVDLELSNSISDVILS